MRYLVAILMFLYAANVVKAQTIDNQEVKLFAANTLFGGVTTGVGALINKQKNEKAFPVFLNGFKYGCLGGALLYAGKKQSALIAQGNVAVGAWGSRLVHNAGASIMENVALHRAPFSHYNLYLGFVRLELDWQQRFKAQPKLMPISFAVFLYHIYVIKGRFDLGESLKMGTPYFTINDADNIYSGTMSRGSMVMNEYYNRGYVGANNKFYSGSGLINYIKGHENTHGLQMHEHYIFNTYANKPASYVCKKSKVVMSLSKYIYFDFNLMDFSYSLGRAYGKSKGGYFYNPYEFEAERMALNTYFNVGQDTR